MALRWRRNPLPRGLAGVIAGPMGSTLRDGETEFASTGTYSRNDKRKGWYWVARNDKAGVPFENTCGNPVPDEATAKAAAMAYVRECLKSRTAAQSSTDHPLTRCAAGRDGECAHVQCPQLRDGEPAKSGRHCPLDASTDQQG